MTNVTLLGINNMMKITTSLIVLSMASIVGCSSGSKSSTSDVNAPNDNSESVQTDLSELPAASEYPTNAELAAVDGVPSIEAADILIQGQWKAIDDATQCVTSYEFDSVSNFSHSELDRRGSGTYYLLEEDFGIELDLDYDSENFQSDCRGFIEDSDLLDLGRSVGWGLTFPDQNTMVFSSGSGFSGGRPVYTFTRQ